MKFLITLCAISSIFTSSTMQISNTELGQQLIQASKKGSVKAAQKLIGRGADIKAKDNSYSTALIYAAQKGHIEVIKLLIKEGANINAQNKCGWTALIYAAQNNHTEAIKLLIALGADIEVKDVFGNTALRWATTTDKVKATKLLIKLGADIHTKDDKGNTALMRAATLNKERCCELLVKAMPRFEKKEILCFLFCHKKATENDSDLQYISKDVIQLIAKQCWNETIATHNEINKITNKEIKQKLLEKYFPEKNPSSPKAFSDKGNL